MKLLKINLFKFLVLSLVLTSLFSTSLLAKKHIMWELKKGKSIIYLLGSVHAGTKDMYPLDKIITDAYTKSPEIAVELNMSTIDPTFLMQRAMYTDGTTLKDKLSEKTYKKLKEKMAMAMIPENNYSKMKPFMLVVTLEMIKMQKAGIKMESGIDLHFISKANIDKKKIIELETIESQLDTFEKIGEVDEFLNYSLDNSDKGLQEIENILKAWKIGDVKAIEKATNFSAIPGGEKIKEILLDSRNSGMANTVDTMIKEGKSCFVIIGAAHLVGKGSVIDILKKKGYSIKQL